MKITKLEVSNYRNLDGTKVDFSLDCNFIVGENNLGKSNLLELLHIIFSSRFRDSDFSDRSIPIQLELQLKLSDVEIGVFNDLFDVEDSSLINILCRQNSSDDNIEFIHKETNASIKTATIRSINFIYYDSLRNPYNEINFDKGRGAGKFLSRIITSYLVDKKMVEHDFINEENVNELIQNINNKIVNIKTFKDFLIEAAFDKDLNNILSRIIVLQDDQGVSLSKSGYGVQFLLLIVLSILERIQWIYDVRKDEVIFNDISNNTKHLSLVIGLDEPEIHLHPYMQRSLINYLSSFFYFLRRITYI